ncbi:amino acid adenylation domain-containing protein [Polymorphospora sp. NPDC050346]|uniref:amino acid adenylation domain-containing protein n=1 Tax=Polymorphospora sp. NPDC050346 TaxID=3155780 RepID=UPI003408B4D5
MSSVREQVAELSDEEKRALLAQLLGQDGNREGERLLPPQRRYWVLHQVSPQVPTHVVRTVDVTGELDVSRLEQAFNLLVDRHEQLRTSFVSVEGRPVAALADAGAVRPGIATFEVGDGSAEPAEEALHKVRVREAGRPFDLDVAPLARVAVVRRTADHHEVQLTAHQMIADEVTADLLLGQLAEAYDALSAGREPAEAPVAASVTAVVDRQRSWLGTAAARRELEFWTRRLAAVPNLDLPIDHPRPLDRMPLLKGARSTVELGPELVAAARELAAAQGADLSSVAMAGLLAVVARYTREKDIAIGIPVAGRDDADLANTLGTLENTVVVRSEVGADTTLRQLVDQVYANTEQARAHQQLPFEQVVAKLRPEADFSRSPLHQIRFVDSQPKFDTREVGGASWRLADLDIGLAAFDLTVYLRHTEDGRTLLHGEYNAELFKSETIGLFLEHLTTLLTRALAEPDRGCASLPMLSEAETAKVLTEWNDTTVDYPSDALLHDLITAQAARTPDALAVMAGSDRITYQELDTWSNRLARRLRALGVGPETLVGVTASRKIGTVAAFLGVMKAGGGYVPIDPDQPADRLSSLLADAGIRVMVAADDQAAFHQEASDVWVRPDSADVDAESDEPLPKLVDADNVAYVIYTSGSTGRPKGVVVPHRQIVNSTLARSGFGREAPEAYAIPVALSFDASAAGLYWTLTSGGRVVLPSEDQVRNPALLARLVQHERVTHITHMPSYYQLLLAAGGRQLISLKDISAGGDVFPAQLAVDHYKTLPWAHLYNDYGPTEVTVWATAQLSTAEEDGASVPIGRPINNTRVYLLDEQLNPVPVGVPGEIYVAGDGLARGYLGQAGATADRFGPDPFASTPGARIYRTGDLARHLPDGRLEFLGRVDTQVKIRGFRIELGEIENVLQGHDGVLSAVADARRHPTGDDADLIAWIIPADAAAPPSETDLVAHLKRQLPHYMVPGQIVVCEEFPLNAHGKVDRRALPDPVATPISLPSGEVPRRRIEKEIADVFSEALGVARVGLHDDFFSFGGSSLQLSRVGARLSKAYGLELPLHALFSTPTVAGVAARVELYEREGFEGLKATRDAADDLDRESELDETITGENLAQADFFAPKAILLTGATGYFGVFLLDQLIDQTEADIYCLVRARDVPGAIRRLKETCAHYEVPWDDRFERRVKAVVGDLGKPLFGLSPSIFDDLAKLIDVIYHNGALVNFSMPYSALKAPNVDGTVEMLRLASRYKAKQVHFVSTIDVFIAGHMNRPFLELELPSRPPQVPFSYPQSKWVSEKIIMKAKQRGLPVSIYRPSIMMGHPKTGACHAQNYVLTALRGFLEFGILPDYPESMNAITLDYASAAMVHVSRQEASLGNIYHLWNTEAIPHNALFPWIQSFGYKFDTVDFDEAVQLAINAGPDHPIYPMVPVLLLYTSGDAGLEMSMETEDAIDNRSECINLLDGIKGTGYKPAPLDEKYMHDCLAYLVRHGQLDPPEAFPRRR